MNARPGFCATCKAALDPEDDWSRECHVCTDDVIDNDDPPDDSLPEFNWRRRYCAVSPDAPATPGLGAMSMPGEGVA